MCSGRRRTEDNKPARVSFTPEPAQATSKPAQATSAFATTSAQATFGFATTTALGGSSVIPGALKAGEMLYQWAEGEGIPLVLRFCTQFGSPMGDTRKTSSARYPTEPACIVRLPELS
jgi:hypothetical protein